VYFYPVDEIVNKSTSVDTITYFEYSSYSC